MAVHAVALKLPEFWEASASAWFAQTEAQFALRDITADTTRFYYVVSALGSSTASRVVSLLKHPPAMDKYEALKAHLLKTFELSDAERASRLFSLQGLGDSKPSELMDHMLDLLGEHSPHFLFTQLFLRQLPSQVRAALANTTITDCRQLAEEADKSFVASQERYVMAAFLAPHGDPVTMEDSTLIAATSSRRQQSSGRQQPSGPQQSSSGLCFYHEKFGPKAYRCRPPCRFGGSGNARAGAQ
ncbi:uncharacterized protein LOC117772693 [Hippoglossus hippoglossus]|uniref:uncharacterized protein LOC117772693 n=1 Tax=Hippoglossus hippoglossus TaxID=8267 RepID=UPI00148E3F65|nr:uncharacterized protein LOC117772693 [Hippoglossus hippoglossus]